MFGNLSPDEFTQLLKNASFVAIDLVVVTEQGKVLLSRKNNDSAQNTFFVPGGRTTKMENIEHAFCRLVRDKLGSEPEITEIIPLRTRDHFDKFGTHYIVLAYEIQVKREFHDIPSSHYCRYQWMPLEEALLHFDVHENSKTYLYPDVMQSEKQYEIIAKRREETNTLLWQVPAMIFTAEAFLFSIMSSKDVSYQFKFAIACLGCSVSFASTQLFTKHRLLEKHYSELLEQFEIRNAHNGYARIHRNLSTQVRNVERCFGFKGIAEYPSNKIWKFVLTLTTGLFATFGAYYFGLLFLHFFMYLLTTILN